MADLVFIVLGLLASGIKLYLPSELATLIWGAAHPPHEEDEEEEEMDDREEEDADPQAAEIRRRWATIKNSGVPHPWLTDQKALESELQKLRRKSRNNAAYGSFGVHFYQQGPQKCIVRTNTVTYTGPPDQSAKRRSPPPPDDATGGSGGGGGGDGDGIGGGGAGDGRGAPSDGARRSKPAPFKGAPSFEVRMQVPSQSAKLYLALMKDLAKATGASASRFKRGQLLMGLVRDALERSGISEARYIRSVEAASATPGGTGTGFIEPLLGLGRKTAPSIHAPRPVHPSTVRVDRSNPRCIRGPRSVLSSGGARAPVTPVHFSGWSASGNSAEELKPPRLSDVAFPPLQNLPPLVIPATTHGDISSGGGGGGGGGGAAAATAVDEELAVLLALPRACLLVGGALSRGEARELAAKAAHDAAELATTRRRTGSARSRKYTVEELGAYTSSIGCIAAKRFDADKKLWEKYRTRTYEKHRTQVRRDMNPLRPRAFDGKGDDPLFIANVSFATELVDCFTVHATSCTGTLRITELVTQKLHDGRVILRCSLGDGCCCFTAAGSVGRKRVALCRRVELQGGTKTSSAAAELVYTTITNGMLGAHVERVVQMMGWHLPEHVRQAIEKATYKAITAHKEEDEQRIIGQYTKNKNKKTEAAADTAHDSARDAEHGVATIQELQTGEIMAQVVAPKPIINEETQKKASSHRIEGVATQKALNVLLAGVGIWRMFVDGCKKVAILIRRHTNPTDYAPTGSRPADVTTTTPGGDPWHGVTRKTRQLLKALEKKTKFQSDKVFTARDMSAKTIDAAIDYVLTQVKEGERAGFGVTIAATKSMGQKQEVLNKMLRTILNYELKDDEEKTKITFTVKEKEKEQSADAEHGAGGAEAAVEDEGKEEDDLDNGEYEVGRREADRDDDAEADEEGDGEPSLVFVDEDLNKSVRKKAAIGETYELEAIECATSFLDPKACIPILNEAKTQGWYFADELSLTVLTGTEGKDRKTAETNLSKALGGVVLAAASCNVDVILARSDAEVPNAAEHLVIVLSNENFSELFKKGSKMKKYFVNADYFQLHYSTQRKRTREVYHLITQHKWRDPLTEKRTLGFVSKFRTHMYHCITCKQYKTGLALHTAIFNIFPHICGDHAACSAACPQTTEPWQKNAEYRAQVKALNAFMRKKLTVSECKSFVHCGFTSKVESYFAYLLRWRPKNVHFPTSTCEARCNAGRNEWNSNPRHISDISIEHGGGYETELRRRMNWRTTAKETYFYVTGMEVVEQ